MNLMLIEDDLIQATSLKFQLEQLNYQNVVIARNAEDACKALEKQYYDLVFCDIRMPGIDGIKLLATSVDKERVGGVVITSSVEDAILGVTRGVCNLIGYAFVEILTKPFSIEGLKVILNKFRQQSNKITEAMSSYDLTEQDIRDAFLQDGFFVHYQPQFDFKSGQLFGVEALVRLEHPSHGVVPPITFLPMIEKLGFEKELFTLVLDKSTKAMSTAGRDVKLSVNITQTLLQLDLCDIILEICQKNHFPTANLTIELTEEQAYNSSSLSLANLARLRLYGIGIALDDFGTGYASLDKLVDLPFTELKIDRTFISSILDNYKLQQITNLSLKLAQSLGLNCVAEGVEDVETWEYLKEIGVDICQGYYTGKPMHMKEICKYADLYRHEPNATEANYGHLSMLVMDTYSESTSAIARLVSKDLIGSNIIALKNINDIQNHLRDLPINWLVVEKEIYLSVIATLDNQLLSELNFIVITDANTVELQNFGEKMVLIERSSDIRELVTTISQKVVSSSNDEDSLHSRFSMLSQREFDVTKLLIAGFSNKYISFELGINQKTVSTYKARVLQKLNVKSTVDLVRIFGESDS